MIVGIDEVGRGPWAGPLVMGAVVLGCEIDGLTDSKKLSKKRREELNDEILESAQAVGLGWVSAEEIDELGLSMALTECCKRALQQIKVSYHEIIIDGTVNFLKETGKGSYVTLMKKADLLVPSVSAASIVAKVARDRFMEEQDILYPNYGFNSHAGYGTAAHRAAIEKYGVTPLHRLSFAPLQKYRDKVLPLPQASKSIDGSSSTTRQIGNASEAVAARELIQLGHEILERNWRTKYCEIDIVSQKDGTIYFVEVKHRRVQSQGGGVAAITPKKLHKMEFAAKLYTHANRLYASNIRMAVLTTRGDPPEVETYLVLE